MTDTTQTNQGAGQGTQGSGQGTQDAGQSASNSGVVVDKNKSAADYIKEVEASYIVPDMIREKFPDLVKLIYETESMNEEEREYWLQIMPIMSEDQTVKFREILVNEKKQLAKLDEEYEQEMTKMKSTAAKKEISDEEIKAKMLEIQQAESAHESGEQEAEADLLKSLEGL